MVLLPSRPSPDDPATAEVGCRVARKLFGVQYLRAVAAIAVAMVHVGPHFGHPFAAGASGVDLFFLISGFLMVAVTSRETNAIAFLKDRIERIAPVYWLATSVMLAGGLTGLFPAMRLGLWHSAASYLFLPAVSPSNGKVWPLLVPGWTLNYEMAFYAVFALFLRLRRPILAIALLTILFGGLVLTGWLAGLRDPIAAFYTDGVIVEFAIGCWIGMAWKDPQPWPRFLGWPLLIGALALLCATLSGPISSRLVQAGLPLAALLVAVLAIERRVPIPRIGPLALLGDASYSIYIWHGLAISVAVALLARFHIGKEAAVVATFVAAVLAGIASYIVLERPLMTYFRRRRHAVRTFDPIGKGVTIVPRSASDPALPPSARP